MNFYDFAKAHGVLIDRLIQDGRIHRCPTVEHERKRNGAYCYDGARGWVHAWDGEGVTQFFNDPHAKPWDDSEKRAHMAQRAREQQARNQRAAQNARTLLERAEWAPAAYMSYKGFKAPLGRYAKPEWKHGYGLVVDSSMFIPMYSLSGEIVGGQTIRWDGEQHEKKMLPGTKAKGAVYVIGDKRAPTKWLCEGFATGISIRMALDQLKFPDAVIVCFSDSNMVHVASQIAGRRLVFADNDKSGAGERAAIATGLPYCMAPDVGMDANDLHQRDGLFAVCGLIQSTRSTDSIR